MSSLAEAVQQSLSEWKPTGGGRHTLAQAYPDAGWALTATFEKAEALGGSAWELALDRTGDVPQGFTLNMWAEGVAERVSGLLETLKVHEIDELEGVALLRSEGPQVRGSNRNYYEVTLEGVAQATLQRFRGDTTPGSRRERIAFALTYESIGQVVAGIAGD